LRFFGFVLLLISAHASAESVRYFELEGFGSFLEGNPESTAVDEDGAVTLPPQARDWFVDADATFSAATVWNGNVVVARVDNQKVLAIDKNGQTQELYHAKEALVTALLGVDDDLYVAAGPNKAKIYRLKRGAKAATLFFESASSHIWSMAQGPKGVLYVATGDPGTIVRIEANGQGKVVFAPEQTNMRSVAYHAKLGLFAGGGERGILYRSTNDKEFRALYDGGHTEIAGILVDDEYAYAASVTGSDAVDNEKSRGKKPKGNDGQVRSELTRVAMDGTSESLAGSDDEIILALAWKTPKLLWVATASSGKEDPRGRLYSVVPKAHKISLLYQSPSRKITFLLPYEKTVLAIGGAGARITELSSLAKKGAFFTTPFDTGIASKYGFLQLFAEVQSGTHVRAAVRTGQTSEPDGSWSNWSKEISTLAGNTDVPFGRYMQIRLTLEGNGTVAPEVYRLRLAYLRHNLPPFVREVTTLDKGQALTVIPKEESHSKTISLNAQNSDDNSSANESKRADRAKQTQKRGALTVKWFVEDPNGDDMLYDLFVRASPNDAWQLLQAKLDDPFLTLQSTQLPDGYYQFRVVATDAPSNPDGMERTDERESRTVLIDNSPPTVEKPSAHVRGRQVTIDSQARDSVSPLRDATYSLDGQAPRPLAPVDGLLDAPQETFAIQLRDLAKGGHTLTIYVKDQADNEAFGQVEFSVK
jgi:hypothetical protein